MSEMSVNLRKATAVCTCLLGVVLACLYQRGIGVYTCASAEGRRPDFSLEEDEASLMQVNLLAHVLSQRRAPLEPARTNNTANNTANDTSNDTARHRFDQSLKKKGKARSPSPSPTSHLAGPRPVGSLGPSFVIISCPELGKVVYTEVALTASTSGSAHTLVESLVKPKGLAVDNYLKRLYIADPGKKEIYTVGVQYTGTELYADARVIVAENVIAESLTVDQMGNLYFTEHTSRISMINYRVITEILLNTYTASQLQIMPVEDAITKALELKIPVETYLTSSEPVIYTLFGPTNPYVSLPGGLGMSGYDLFWTNEKNGLTNGTVAQGVIDPYAAVASPNLAEPFPASIFAANAPSAYGLAATSNFVFWSTNTSEANSGAIYIQEPGFGGAYEIVSGLMGPRGLVWDGDGTIYYADSDLGRVGSFPSGRVMEDAPVTDMVDVESAHGLGFMSFY
mmetsp:Transcript_152101/g.283399  ORF Transcript_152101/g.283399 Transcript_152101/m.283399 type:complete len:454 (-) Transcript_152101:81-1442(-)